MMTPAPFAVTLANVLRKNLADTSRNPYNAFSTIAISMIAICSHRTLAIVLYMHMWRSRLRLQLDVDRELRVLHFEFAIDANFDRAAAFAIDRQQSCSARARW
jgi:hypothetical protein